MKESIFEHEGVTAVAFGVGSIQMGFTIDDSKQVQVFLSDTMKEHVIGPELHNWDRSPLGRMVVLGFNKVESIEVLELVLKEAKAALLGATK